MKIHIIADAQKLQAKSWNKSIGNKILHLLFTFRVAEEHGFQPIIPCESILDQLFLWKNKTRQNLNCPPPIYIETWPYPMQTLEGYIQQSKVEYEEHLNFLNNVGSISTDFSVRGNFPHFNLMPSYKTVQKYTSFHPDLISSIKEKYPEITDNNSVAIHYRGTDYNAFLKHIFPDSVVLDKSYYSMALAEVEKKISGPITYHLFSDNISVLLPLLKGRSYVVHNDTALQDWLAMHMMKNIISSNSTFAWTASLYNKKIVVQPKDGFNFYKSNGSIPYGFLIQGAIAIHNKRSPFQQMMKRYWNNVLALPLLKFLK